MKTFEDEDLDFLEHYGILGMKWGVRKSRPRSGKISSGGSSSGSSGGKIKRSGPPQSSVGRRSTQPVEDDRKDNKARDRSTGPSSSGSAPPAKNRMTDQELRDAINRLDMERRYAELTKTPSVKKKENAAAKAIKQVVGNASKQAAEQVLKNVMIDLLAQGVNAGSKGKINVPRAGGGKKN